MMQKVPVKILREGAVLPTYGTASSAGADLRACLDAPVVLAPGETRLIPIGIAMEIPEGYVGLHDERKGVGDFILHGAVDLLRAVLIFLTSKQCYILLKVVMRNNPPT